MPLVKPPVQKKQLKGRNYRTKTIIDLVNKVAKTDRDDTEGLAKRFQKTKAGLKALFDFVDTHFTYVEDPVGSQWVQTPSYFFHTTREGDCKSFTVFISSVLYNMGISHHIRYTAYGTSDYRHVYPVAILNGKEIPLDVVWKKQEGGKFGRQKLFTNKKDYHVEGLYKLGNTEEQAVMTSIAELEAILADVPDSIIDEGVGDVTKMTSGTLDRVLMRERLQIFADQTKDTKLLREYRSGIEAIRKGTVAGIGNLIQTKFGANLEQFLRASAYDNAPAFQPFTLAIPNSPNVSGLGFKKKIVGLFKKLFKKLVNWIFKGTARKMAPYFLFTFIKKQTSSKSINKRRAAQQKSFDWIKRVGKFDDKKLNALVFNEIKKETGMTPAELLNKGADKKIGVLPVAAVAAFAPKALKAVGLVIQVIKKIGGIFNKKKEEAGEVSEANAPDLKLLEELNEKPVDPADKQDSSGLLLATGIAALGIYFVG